MKNKWGGKRQNAGRKKSESSKKTIVVRVDEELLSVITELKEKHKLGCDIANLINVINNQEEQSTEIEQLLNRNLELLLQRDKEHLQTVKLKGQVQSLKHTLKSKKVEIKSMYHNIYDCQALKKNGNRCTRSAKVKTNWHGVEINTCIQHSGIN